MKKHYFLARLKPLVPGIIPPPEIGVSAKPKDGMPASVIATMAVLATLPEADRDKYEVSVQHMGTVDVEA